MNKNKAVGFCGLGMMGSAMVDQLLNKQIEVHVWNRSTEKIQPFLQRGVVAHSTPKALAEACDVILLCVSDQHAVDQVVFGEEGLALALRPIVVVDHSSISPEDTVRFSRRLHACCLGIWLDAPVSGGIRGVINGSLTVMVGGDADALDKAKPFLKSYAERITHMGDSGAGQITKLCNQVIVAATVNAIGEAISLGVHSGIDVTALNEALAGGWADSLLLQIFVPRMTEGYEKILGTPNTMRKDIQNILHSANLVDIKLPLTEQLERNFSEVDVLGYGEKDLSDIIRSSWSDKP